MTRSGRDEGRPENHGATIAGQMRLGVAAALVDGVPVRGDVEVADGRVAAVGLPSPRGSGIAAPGFVDLQVNGFAGVDFGSADAGAYAHAGEALLATGVTAYLPTLVTASEEDLAAALREVPARAPGPRILGVHLEGPFISPEHPGVHPVEHIRLPDLALADRLLDAGPVRSMTLAPELPGAVELTRHLLARRVVVSAGHSAATAQEAARAFDAGIRTVTHLFNAMAPFAHRAPGLAGAALARDDVVVQLIVDGSHLAPETVRLAWSAAAGRVALVTDAIAAAGHGDGSYTLGGSAIAVREGVARRADGTLAGTTLTMLDAVRNAVALGVRLADALAAASSVPSRVLGDPDLGVLRPGARADLVVLDDDLSLRTVLVAGRAA
jgi:N-acetylglucosamine-6-phosphate deacetylase